MSRSSRQTRAPTTGFPAGEITVPLSTSLSADTASTAGVCPIGVVAACWDAGCALPQETSPATKATNPTRYPMARDYPSGTDRARPWCLLSRELRWDGCVSKQSRNCFDTIVSSTWCWDSPTVSQRMFRAFECVGTFMLVVSASLLLVERGRDTASCASGKNVGTI